MTPKESFLSPTALFLLFYDFDVALDLAWEGDFLEMDSSGLGMGLYTGPYKHHKLVKV